ncbi:unnamed protein product, partial [Rotaria magnacalcarata]
SMPVPQVPTCHECPFDEPLYAVPVRKADAMAVATAALVTSIPIEPFVPYKFKDV